MNGNSSGRVYIDYTEDEIGSNLNCGRDKAMRLLAELDTGKGVGLIERVRQGLCQTLYHPRRPYPTAGAFPQATAFQRPRLRKSRSPECKVSPLSRTK